MANFGTLLDFYRKVQSGYYYYDNKTGTINASSKSTTITIASYVTRLQSYDKNWNGGKTYSQLDTIIKSKSSDPMADAMNYFSRAIPAKKPASTINSFRCAYKSFCETIIGRYDANVWLNAKFSHRLNMNAYEMIAETAIFASPEIVFDLINKKGHPHACWFINPYYYIRDQKNVGKPTTDCKGRPCVGDRNQKANLAIKKAIYGSCKDVAIANIGSFCNYEACHIVPNSTNNRDYYTSIPNLCLIPRAIAGLSDHFQNIIDILNYHAITLYSLPYKKPTLSPSLMKIYSGLKWRVNY